MLTVIEALAAIEKYSLPLPAESILLGEALGRVLAEDALADCDSPPHDKAMMDGFAVRVADGVNQRRIVETIFAGTVPTVAVGMDEASRIMTGAPLPVGADAVVPIEVVTLRDELFVTPHSAPVVGKHMQRRGDNFRRGDAIVRAGQPLRSAEIAALAEIGVAEPRCFPEPRVAVLATGDELVSPNQVPAAGQIRNSNGPMLCAAVREAGAAPIDLGVGRDEPAHLREKLLEGLTADVLLVSGGVSAGDKDLAPGLLVELGVEQIFHKIAMRPGKPLWFGRGPANPNGRRPLVFGLPGNPASSFVCFQLFVRPLLSGLSGGGFQGLVPQRVELAMAYDFRGERETYVPAKLSITGATPTRWRSSGDLSGLVGAEVLLTFPPGDHQYAAGTELIALALPK